MIIDHLVQCNIQQDKSSLYQQLNDLQMKYYSYLFESSKVLLQNFQESYYSGQSDLPDFQKEEVYLYPHPASRECESLEHHYKHTKTTIMKKEEFDVSLVMKMPRYTIAFRYNQLAQAVLQGIESTDVETTPNITSRKVPKSMAKNIDGCISLNNPFVMTFDTNLSYF